MNIFEGGGYAGSTNSWREADISLCIHTYLTMVSRFKLAPIDYP